MLHFYQYQHYHHYYRRQRLSIDIRHHGKILFFTTIVILALYFLVSSSSMSLHQYLYYHDIIYQPASKNIRNKDKWILLFSLSRKSKAFPLSDPFRLFSLVFPIRTFPGTTSLRRIARNRRTWRKRAIAAAAKTTTTARAGAKITSTSRNLTFIRPANKWFQSLNWWKTPFFLGIAHIGGALLPYSS